MSEIKPGEITTERLTDGALVIKFLKEIERIITNFYTQESKYAKLKGICERHCKNCLIFSSGFAECKGCQYNFKKLI